MAKANGRNPPPLFTAEEMKILTPILDQNPPIEELSIEVLKMDPEYQTRPRERMRQKIAFNYHQGLFGVLRVSRRPDGTYWVVDGWTRVLALLDRGEKHKRVPCQIFETEGQKPEALLFSYFNGRRSHQPTKLETNFQAESVAGTDHGFGRLIERCGFTLNGTSNRRVRGPAAWKSAWNLDGDGEVLQKALLSLNDGWGDKYKIPGYVVFGIALLYRANSKPIDFHVRHALKRTSPNDLNDRIAKAYIKAGGRANIRPDEKPEMIARALADIHNKNPGKAGKLDISKLAQARDEV